MQRNSFQFKPVVLPLMVLMALYAMPSIAEEPDAVVEEASADVETLETVQVRDTATSAGESTTVIDLEEKERLNPSDLQDLFRSTPSVQVGSSIPISQKVYVNGVEETNLSITIDGARQNNKLFHHAGTNIIDPELLKAVRVDAGVAPADAGPGALGGSIAYETKDVTDLLAPGDNFGGAIGLEYNNNGHTFDRDVSLYGRSNGLEGLAYIKKATGHDFEDGDGQKVAGSEAALDSGLFKVGYLHSSGYRAKVSFERARDDSANRPFRANFAGRFAGDALQRYLLDRQTITASVKDETPEGLFNPYIKLAHSETELRTGELNGGYYDSVNGTIANEFVLEMGSINAGVDFYDDSSEGVFPGFYSIEEKAKNIGVFAQARLSPIERLRVSFGARHDDHELEGVDGSDSDNDGVSSNISGEFDVTNFITASAGYSHVFGGVQVAEPYVANPAWVYPAGGLKESKANNSFVGLTFSGAGLNASLSGITLGAKHFRTDIKNIRDEEFGGGPDIYSDLASDGFEINGRYDWQSGFFRVSYIDVDTEINGITGGTEAQYIGAPLGKVLRADFVQSFDSVGVSVGADIQHYFAMDGHDDFSTPTRQKDAFPEYVVANAFIAYTPLNFKNLTLRASLNNIFDEAYADRASYGQEYAASFGTQILQEPGRSFVIGAKLKF